MNRQTFVNTITKLLNAYDDDMALCNALINLWRVKNSRSPFAVDWQALRRCYQSDRAVASLPNRCERVDR